MRTDDADERSGFAFGPDDFGETAVALRDGAEKEARLYAEGVAVYRRKAEAEDWSRFGEWWEMGNALNCRRRKAENMLENCLRNIGMAEGLDLSSVRADIGRIFGILKDAEEVQDFVADMIVTGGV